MICWLLMSMLAGDPARADVADLHPVTGPEAPPPLPPAPLWPWMVLAGGLGLGFCGWLVRRRLNRPKPEPSPYDWATSELDRLLGADWSRPATVERFASTLRGFLQRQFAGLNPSQVTAELTGPLKASGLQPEVVERWNDLLNRCDLARFAQCPFATDESAETLRLAQDLLSASLPKSETYLLGQPGEAGRNGSSPGDSAAEE